MSARPELDEFLHRVLNLPRQGKLDAAAVEVLDAFEAVGVESLLLKGPALARTLYGAGEHRAYGDIDLLVPHDALKTAREALAGLGYENASAQRGIDDVACVVHSEAWSLPPETPTTLPVMVDLHWCLPGWEAPAEVMWQALAARRARVELEGRAVAVMASDGLALHCATHAAQSAPDHGKALADLARAIERWGSEVWRSATRLAEDVEATAALAAGLRLTADGARLASELGLPRSDELAWTIENRTRRPRGTFHLQALAQARTVRERTDVLRRSLFPRRRWIEWEYRWASGSRARLLAAYAAHLARAPVWAARAWRYRRRQRRARG